mmetsp:Transcript_5651/g.10128  ORF Transcript_5651/g.10128 Transcript_5651/m.10128 type:complete len:243 (+) Transcript_5651:1455-2183(+)
MELNGWAFVDTEQSSIRSGQGNRRNDNGFLQTSTKVQPFVTNKLISRPCHSSHFQCIRVTRTSPKSYGFPLLTIADFGNVSLALSIIRGRVTVVSFLSIQTGHPIQQQASHVFCLDNGCIAGDHGIHTQQVVQFERILLQIKHHIHLRGLCKLLHHQLFVSLANQKGRSVVDFTVQPYVFRFRIRIQLLVPKSRRWFTKVPFYQSNNNRNQERADKSKMKFMDKSYSQRYVVVYILSSAWPS